MEQEFKAIIEKNLPAQVGDVLKKRLEQADNDSVKIKQLEEQIGNRNQHVTKLEATIAEYKKFDDRNAALEAREKACDIQERDFKVKTLEHQLQTEKEKTQFCAMGNIGVFVNGKEIGVINSVNIDDVSEYTSPGFKDLGNPNQYEFYMRHKNRIWLRNAYGKLSIEADKLGEVTKDIKYGQKLIINTGALSDGNTN